MTVLRTHECDGTVGTASTRAGEGFDTVVGSDPTYVAGGVSGTALRWTSTGSDAYYYEDAIANSAYMGFYFRLPTLPSADLNLARILTSIDSSGPTMLVHADGTLSIYSSANLSNLQGTTAVAVSVDTWYRIEWYDGGAGQEFRLFSPYNAATPTETLTGTGATGAGDTFRVGNEWKFGGAGDTFDLDHIVIADDWPNLGTSTPSGGAAIRGVFSGGVEVAATLRGVISGGIEVPATLRDVVTGGVVGAIIPQTIPFKIGD